MVDDRQQLRVEEHAAGSIVLVTGSVDETVALELGSVLDDLCDARQHLVCVELANAELSLAGWVTLERAITRYQRRGTALRIESGPDGPMPQIRRDAREWLAVLRTHLK